MLQKFIKICTNDSLRSFQYKYDGQFYSSDAKEATIDEQI